MTILVIAWLLFGIVALAPPAFLFFYMRRNSVKPWSIKIDRNYKPRVSILVPTYNESNIIPFKLINLSRLKYPLNLLETIVVDSNSSDGTDKIIQQFCGKEPQIKIKLLSEKERKGKSHALSYGLQHCTGDVIIVSDADCFWPSQILEQVMPFLADETVGAISGPKILLNSHSNWITRMEERYLKSANSLRLGESKAGSTFFFEGGFSAFKKGAFVKFDPYNTGSDDCGTVINVIEKNFKALLVPDAEFFSVFPESYRGRVEVKLRRANQLVRVFRKYLDLLSKSKINIAKRTVILNTFLYLFSPIAFALFIFLTFVLLLHFPFSLIAFTLLLISQLRFYCFVILESNLFLLAGIFSVLTGKKFSIWRQPEDRILFSEETLRRFNLI